MRNSSWRIFKFLCFAGIAIVLLVTALLVINQRSLVFLPPAEVGTATPADYKVPFEQVTITSSDGVKLDGWWIERPKSSDNAKAQRPVLLYSHGNGATLSQLTHVAKLFYDLDLDVLFYDYRNYGRSGRAPSGLSEEGLAIDSIAARDFVDQRAPDRPVIYWGHSLGSSVAAKLAVARPPDGLVLEGSFTSMFNMARERYPWLPIFSFMVFDKFATAEYVKQGSEPLLIMHSEFDTIVPIRQGQEVYELAHAPKKFVLLKGIDHLDFPSVVQNYHEVLNEFRQLVIENWLKRHNA